MSDLPLYYRIYRLFFSYQPAPLNSLMDTDSQMDKTINWKDLNCVGGDNHNFGHSVEIKNKKCEGKIYGETVPSMYLTAWSGWKAAV